MEKDLFNNEALDDIIFRLSKSNLSDFFYEKIGERNMIISGLNSDFSGVASTTLTGCSFQLQQLTLFKRLLNEGELILEFLLENKDEFRNWFNNNPYAYFKQCSIEIDCVDLARIGLIFANYGIDIETGERVISENVSRMVKTFMVTCGMYDASGEFAIKVGIPAKSGVGGGIMASVPRKMGIGVYGPSLDKKGNSIAGIKVLEDLSKQLELSIF